MEFNSGISADSKRPVVNDLVGAVVDLLQVLCQRAKLAGIGKEVGMDERLRTATKIVLPRQLFGVESGK
jgi:hypothetical protein